MACDKMLPLRYYLLAAIAVALLWWPLKFLIGYYLHKRRVTKITKNLTAIDDYPLLGCALRFLGKTNKGCLICEFFYNCLKLQLQFLSLQFDFF